MLKKIQTIVVSAALVFATICFAGDIDNAKNNARIVFLYNEHEYPAGLFEKADVDQSIPGELRASVQPGDSIGYRRYDGNIIVEEVSGSATEDGQIVFSNGVGFSARKMTIYDIFKKLKAIIIMLHTPNFGYLE